MLRMALADVSEQLNDMTNDRDHYQRELAKVLAAKDFRSPPRLGMLAIMENANAKKPIPDDSDVLDLCCGGKRCPAFRDDGDSIVIADPDQVQGEIRLSKADLPRVVAWLSKRSAG